MFGQEEGGVKTPELYMRELDLSKLDTGQVTSMWCMFEGCKNLKQLDLSSFYMPKVTNDE